MSRTRQEAPPVRSTAFDLTQQSFQGLGAGWHQLLFPAKGALHVSIGDTLWVIPQGQALWIPAGVRHRIEVTGPAGVRSIFFRRSLSGLPGRPPRRVRISPLLREILRRTLELGTLDPDRSDQAHLLAVLLDELATVRRPALTVRTPRDPRAARAAQAILAAPGAATTLTSMARTTATSARTLGRLFREETGLGFGAWRQQARLAQSIKLIGDGLPVARAAAAVGYLSASAFVTAFKRAFGVTPGRYFDAD
jgi:AraC-like DNA-binding protein